MKLYLSDFSEIATQSLAQKASKVRETKARCLEPYSPAKDFYKRLRDGIVTTHREDGSGEQLEPIIFGTVDPKRKKRYALLVPAYRKWLGARKFSWAAPPRCIYRYRDAEVVVNPELGLTRGKVNYVIKLYFKKNALKRASADLITGLMTLALPKASDVVYGVLDVERGKLFLAKKAQEHTLEFVVKAELSYICDMWVSLQKAA